MYGQLAYIARETHRLEALENAARAQRHREEVALVDRFRRRAPGSRPLVGQIKIVLPGLPVLR